MSDLYVDKHSNLLILGRAANDFAVGEVVYSEDYEEVLAQYGESDLSRAFKEAQDMGVKYIFVMNLRLVDDYFKVADILKEGDFAYIAFASLLLSDTFQDTFNSGLYHSVLAYLLGTIGHNCNSTFVVTGEHASLYEDIDAFLKDMNAQRKEFLSYCSSRAELRNLIFVANNLQSYKNAAVPLAAALCTTPVYAYPTSYKFGEAIFDIDTWDCPGEMAYFRSNLTRETTVENLINMMQSDEPEKVVFVDRIMKFIMRDIEYQEFKGHQYTAYKKLLFEEKLTQYMESIMDKVIKDYSIDKIEAIHDGPGTVMLSASLRVVPVGCLEVCSLRKDVQVG